MHIIIHGLTESTDDNVRAGADPDEEQIEQLLHEIGCDEVSVAGAVWLGRKQDASSADYKPRPLKLVLASEDQKDKILYRSKNLRGKKDKGLDKVFIHQDLTPQQRKRRRQLVTELKDRQSKGEKNLIIVNGRIVPRRGAQETAKN